MPEAVAAVKKGWNDVFPNALFHYFFLNETYDQQYQADARSGKVIASSSALAVFIACLGLFGLSALPLFSARRKSE